MGILGACVSKKSQVSDLELQGDLVPCLDLLLSIIWTCSCLIFSPERVPLPVIVGDLHLDAGSSASRSCVSSVAMRQSPWDPWASVFFSLDDETAAQLRLPVSRGWTRLSVTAPSGFTGGVPIQCLSRQPESGEVCSYFLDKETGAPHGQVTYPRPSSQPGKRWKQADISSNPSNAASKLTLTT